MVDECFGVSGKTQVNEIEEQHLPVILITFKEKGSVSIKTVIQGILIRCDGGSGLWYCVSSGNACLLVWASEFISSTS